MAETYSGLILENNSELTRLANAIRINSGNGNKLTVAQMCSEIDNIYVDSIAATYLDNLDNVASSEVLATNSSLQSIADLQALSEKIQNKLNITPKRNLSVVQMAYVLENAVESVSKVSYTYSFRAVATCCDETDSDGVNITCKHNGESIGDTYYIYSLPYSDYCGTTHYFDSDHSIIVNSAINQPYIGYNTSYYPDTGYGSFAQVIIEGTLYITGVPGDSVEIAFVCTPWDSVRRTFEITLGTTTSNDLMDTVNEDEEIETSVTSAIYIDEVLGYNTFDLTISIEQEGTTIASTTVPYDSDFVLNGPNGETLTGEYKCIYVGYLSKYYGEPEYHMYVSATLSGPSVDDFEIKFTNSQYGFSSSTYTVTLGEDMSYIPEPEYIGDINHSRTFSYAFAIDENEGWAYDGFYVTIKDTQDLYHTTSSMITGSITDTGNEYELSSHINYATVRCTSWNDSEHDVGDITVTMRSVEITVYDAYADGASLISDVIAHPNSDVDADIESGNYAYMTENS